ncbi:MAG TPA: hypothetical protein VFY42_06740 [Gemmatimonadales bacterium]|nr:hypothetical protein [Gemmatimonadales bacterium]
MTTFRRLTRWAVALAALTHATGCSSPEEKADRAARTARSWSATARITSEALATGAVPRVYARQVLQAAMEARRKLAQQQEWRSLSPDARSRLEDAVRELASTLAKRGDSLPRP